MKKTLIRVIAVVTLMAVMCCSAVLAVEPRESAYISAKLGGITATGGGSMRISFRVVATGMMDKLGAQSIHIYTEDGVSAASIYYTDPGCSNMMTTNDYSYSSNITWDEGVSGESYYAVIMFYAKNSTGSDLRSFVTTTVTV